MLHLDLKSHRALAGGKLDNLEAKQTRQARLPKFLKPLPELLNVPRKRRHRRNPTSAPLRELGGEVGGHGSRRGGLGL